MKIDFWRLMGVTWGMAIVSDVLWLLTYPLMAVSTQVFIAKDIILTVAITFVLLRYYFEKAPEAPSLEHGAKLGLIILAVSFAVGFVSSFAAATVGLPSMLPPTDFMPEWYMPFQAVLAAVMVVSAAFTGWYLKKH